jgi:probable HAF family extracellular repeat protein
VSRATRLFALSSLAVAAGCSDQSAPTAPVRPTALIATVPTPTPYTVTVDPPVILEGFAGSTYSMGSAINAAGDGAGVSRLGGVLHSVRWSAGSTVVSDVGIGTGRDINAAGQVAGDYGTRAAVWTPNAGGGYTMTNIGEQLPSGSLSSAYGINATGQVVGYYRFQAGGKWVAKCFVWTPVKANATTGTVTTLPDFDGGFCVASDINSSGYVVGNANTATGEMHGFVWSPPTWGRLGKFRDLTPGGGMSSAVSINDAGVVAGQHVTATAGNAAIWTPGGGGYVLTDLGTFTGTQSWALDINDAGFVVGFVEGSDQTDHAFLWQNGEFTLLPGTTSSTTASALTGLNGNSVQVIGTASDVATGAFTALRWNVTVAPLSASSK